MGDAYLATVGPPDSVADKSIKAAGTAVELAEAMNRFNAHSRYGLNVRIRVETVTGAKRRRMKSNYEL